MPVYYGGDLLLNITKLPSYILASQFSSPRDLASYLLYLDANPGEYQKYIAWRYQRQPFTNEYLDTLKYRVPGAQEISLHLNSKNSPQSRWFNLRQRAASCCRLCDEHFMKQAKSKPKTLISQVRMNSEIFRKFMKMDYLQGQKNISRI